MTALPPQTDEQWADLRRRFPSSEEDRHWRGDRYIKTGAGASFSRPQIDALRAAGLWREHDDDEADRLTKVLHVIKDLVGEPYSRKVAIRGLNGWTPHAGQNPRDFDGPADPEPAPVEPTLDDAMLGLSRLQDILTESASALGHLIPAVRHLVSIQEIRAAAAVLNGGA